MKRAYFFMAGFLAVLMLGAIVPARAADPDTLYIRYIEGAVSLSEAGSPQAMGAVVNTPLIEGDSLATGPNGKAELFLKDGSIVRVGKNSVSRITGTNERGIQFTVQQGTAYVVSRGSREVPIFFEIPRTSLDISSPSTVRIDAYSNGINEISVLKGSIFVSDRTGRMLVRQGERLVLKPDGTIPAVAALRAPDEWLQWNAGRDATLVAGTAGSDSYAYLPEELRTYSSDLDANGQWIYTPEYEYVWVPTVIAVGAWSPYRYGRWAWIGGNYVWIGYEPWGYVPYHYGRWVHYGRAGWCWVPPRHRDVRWEPAHVAWVHSSRQIGWVPLAPGERYDRRTAPVIHQTNVFNVTYNNVTVERSAAAARTSYRNAAVANSMVTVERDRMLSQRTLNVTAASKGAVTLRKVSLPAGVTPVHAPARGAAVQMAPATQASQVPSRVSAAGQKGLTASGTSTPQAGAVRPEVATRQIPGPSLSSRIESARNAGRKDVQPPPGAMRTPETRKVTAPSPAPTVAPLGQRIEAMSAPAAKPDQKPAVEPRDVRKEAHPRNTAASSPPPATPPRPPEATKIAVRPVPAREPEGRPQGANAPSVNSVTTGRPGNTDNPTSARTSYARPPAKEPQQAVRATIVNPGPSPNQASPAYTEKRPAPVAAAPAPAQAAPARQPVTFNQPVKSASPQAALQRPASTPPPARVTSPSPAPRAAVSKPAPAPSPKNDQKAEPNKNSKPHA